MTLWIDGRWTLQQQENSLGGTESGQFQELTAYTENGKQAGADGVVVSGNTATLQNQTGPVKALRLVTVGNEGGLKELFRTTIYVGGSKTAVVVCREK